MLGGAKKKKKIDSLGITLDLILNVYTAEHACIN